jgi:hydrogenase nickel incorporation protein HypA/HybF
MHELSLAVAIVEQALRAAADEAAGRRVSEVHVEVGELSGAVPELLVDAFPFASEGTALSEARLRVRRTSAEFECRECARRFGLGGAVGCPGCGSQDVALTSGREIRLVALEVEDG